MYRCLVWESHADPEIRRVCKPGPEPVYPACVVSESDKGVDDQRVAAVATPQSTPDQVEFFFRRLLAGAAAPTVERLLQRLVAETKVRQPVPVVASEPAGLETLLRSLLSGHLARWASLNNTFPFMLPGWKAEKTPGGYMMISPPGSVVRFDPRTRGGGGGATRITIPREGVAAWTRDPSVSTDVGPQSVPARVSVVLVEETGVRCAGRPPFL